jgi:dihydroorotate dehydrogenase
MGLPNLGHSNIAKTLSNYVKIAGCPIGASIALDPSNTDNIQALTDLVTGMDCYEEANVDFIEINLSCPIVKNLTSSESDVNKDANKDSNIDTKTAEQLNFISENFLKKRNRNLPVIIKFSNDINPNTLTELVDLLIDLDFDGINIGNTSTEYDRYAELMNKDDVKNYKNFTTSIGGGLSGKILKNNSLEKCSIASKHIGSKSLRKEFHLIRTGGIENIDDLKASAENGIILNQ